MTDDSGLDMDAVLNNLEQGKQVNPDAAKERRRRRKSRDVSLEEYKERANYHVSCQECDHETWRIQLRGTQRELWRSDRARCPKCGANDLEFEEL